MTISILISIVLSCLNLAIVAVLLGLATWTDSRSRKIPNRFTYPACLAALVVNSLATFVGAYSFEEFQFSGWGLQLPGTIGFAGSVFGACGCFLVMLVLYDVAGSGGGDVKLATALGACLGLQTGLFVILWCHLIAGVALVAVAAHQQGPWQFGTLLARSFGSVLLPGLVQKPGAADAQILNQTIPLAGFFALAVVLRTIHI